MPRRRNEGLVEQYAVGRAAGQAAAGWAARHGVGVSTVHGRARTEGFGEHVRARREALVARELELLAEHAVKVSTADPVPIHPAGPDELRAD